MPILPRFYYSSGTISITTGTSLVTGEGTAWSAADREAAFILAMPTNGQPVAVGFVAAVDPAGEYENDELPIAGVYHGPTLTDVPYVMVDGLAVANGASQAAVYARFVAFLSQKQGLVGNLADNPDFSLVRQNTLFVDNITRTLYQWRNGLLEPVRVIGAAFNPKGLWVSNSTYAINDLVQTAAGFVYVSNINANLGQTPPMSGANPTSNASWTWFPATTVAQVLNELGIHKITISTADPSGGQDGDLWFKVT